MLRDPRRSPSPLVLLPVALAVLLALPVPSRAGIGDLVKKAKDKAAGAVVEKAAGRSTPAASDAGPAPEFDDDLLELDAPRLDMVLKGLEAGGGVLAGRTALVAKRTRLEQEQSAVSEKYGDAIEAARGKRSEAEQCWHEFLGGKQSEREEQMRQRVMSDAALRERVMALSMAMAQAQASGDAKEVTRLQGELMALTGPTKADSLEAQRKCGVLPALHPMQAKLEALQKDLSAVHEELRANDQKSIDAQVAASGLTAAQFAMARERLLLWCEAVHAKRTPQGFSTSERAAFDAKRTALDAALAPWAP